MNTPSFDVGFVSFTVWPAVVVISLIIGMIVGFIVARKHQLKFFKPLLSFLFTGLIVGRLVYVLRNPESYESLFQMLDIRDTNIDYAGLFIACAIALFVQQFLLKPSRALVQASLSMVATYSVFTLLIMVASSHTMLPETAFTKLDASKVSIGDIAKNRPAVVNLWATSCPPCQRELPVFARAQKQSDEIAIISLNQRESVQRVQAFLQAQEYSLENVLLDTRGEVAETKGIFSFPVTLFYSAEGDLVYSHSGVLSDEALKKNIERYLLQ